MTNSLPTTAAATQCTTVDLQHLADYGYVVVEDFLPVALQDGLKQDVQDLRSSTDKNFTIAKIGHDGMVQDENTPFRDIRYSETCFIGRSKAGVTADTTADVAAATANSAAATAEASPLVDNKSRHALYDVLDSLKIELDTNSVVRKGAKTQQLPILDADLEEVMYAYYPQGGFYRRHKDAEADSISNIRKYSFLLYLNDANWSCERDGGALRIHRDSGGDALPVGELPNFVDVAPRAGTLVLFRSDLVPHEVLDTRKERLAVVGWFLSQETASSPNNALAPVVPTTDAIHPDALAALVTLRDASPRLAAKLKPAPPVNNSGMIWDDWSMPGAPVPAAPVEEFKETDVRYWKKIATFDDNGCITTLSLSGNRLRHLTKEQWQSGLLEHVVTLVLSNTDLSVSDMVDSIFPNCRSTSLKHLHMSGNGWGGDGTKELLFSKDQANALMKQLTTLDLRYNDIGTQGAAALGEILQQEDCLWRALFLEGNQLKDEGITALVASSVKLGSITELYLGQNQIGPDGAASLAQALPGSALQKLYLEGNQIGNAGAMALTVVLETTKDHRLEKLYADMNGIGKDESIRLGRSLNSATFIGEGGLFQD